MYIEKIIFYFIILFFKCNLSFAVFDTIDVSSKVISFSSYCRSGRVTIFVISEHNCEPCIACKNHLLNKHYDMDKVDIHYCLISKNSQDLITHEYEKRPSNKMWGFIEGCTMPPYIYIFGPAKNPLSIIKGYHPETIDYNISLLVDNLDYFKDDLVSYNKNKIENDSEPMALRDENKKLKAELKELNKKIEPQKKYDTIDKKSKISNKNLINQNDSLKSIITIKQDSILRLYSLINSLKSENKSFYEDLINTITKQSNELYGR